MYAALRSTVNYLLFYHFLRSHKRSPSPNPNEAGKVSIAMRGVYYGDYYINLLTHEEYNTLMQFTRYSEFWEGVNKKL